MRGDRIVVEIFLILCPLVCVAAVAVIVALVIQHVLRGTRASKANKWEHEAYAQDPELSISAKPQIIRRTGQKVWPSKWGITLRQCKRFLAECKADPNWRSDNNLYALVEEYVKPRTRGTGTGLAVLLNQSAPLEVNVMVSHAWIENAEDFVKALELSVSDEDFLFICAFSLYQCGDGAGPSIMEQLGETAAESPFHQVLQRISDVGKKDGLLWRYASTFWLVPVLCALTALTMLFLPVVTRGCLPMVDKDWHVVCCSSTQLLNHRDFSLGAFSGSWSMMPRSRTAALISDQNIGFPCALICAACALISGSALRLSGAYQGRMVVVPNRECDLYSRLWCVYEIFVARTLEIPIALAHTLAQAGAASSEKAECGVPEDKNRIRSEIEAYGRRKSGIPEKGYTLVDKSIVKTTKSTRHTLLLPMILQMWPVMLVQIGLLRITVMVPPDYMVSWAVFSMVVFLTAVAIVCSILYVQAKYSQGRVEKSSIFWSSACFILAGGAFLWLLLTKVKSWVSHPNAPFVLPLLLVGTTFILSGISLAGLCTLELVIDSPTLREKATNYVKRTAICAQVMFVLISAAGLAAWKQTPTLAFYSILTFSVVGFPAGFITSAYTWDIRVGAQHGSVQQPSSEAGAFSAQ